MSFILREVGNAGLLVIGNGVNCLYLFIYFNFFVVVAYGTSVPTACVCSFPETIALFRKYIIPNTTISFSPKNLLGVFEVSSYSTSSSNNVV